MSVNGDDWARTWPAPAKLNLMLHVLGRRDDGYHRLQTLFRLIDLCDDLRFDPRRDGRIRLARGAPGVAGDDDLCVRAARALRQATGCEQGVDIHLHKRIPMQGGLGGGSSDAATVLVALDHLWGTRVGTTGLQRLGLTLGADVPVFVAGYNAFAEGVGEVLTPVDLPPEDYLVVRPPAAVATAAVFQAPDLTRSTPPTTISRVLAGEGGNDCTGVVTRLHPVIGEVLAWLAPFGEPRLSGTGACVFMPCTREQAERLLASLPPGCEGWFVHGLDVSPLRALVAAGTT